MTRMTRSNLYEIPDIVLHQCGENFTACISHCILLKQVENQETFNDQQTLQC